MAQGLSHGPRTSTIPRALSAPQDSAATKKGHLPRAREYCLEESPSSVPRPPGCSSCDYPAQAWHLPLWLQKQRPQRSEATQESASSPAVCLDWDREALETFIFAEQGWLEAGFALGDGLGEKAARASEPCPLSLGNPTTALPH